MCSLHVGTREAVTLAPAGGGRRRICSAWPGRLTWLRALTVEVLDAVVRDAFEADDTIDLDLEIVREPGDLKLVVRDRERRWTSVRLGTHHGSPNSSGSDSPTG